MERAAIRQLLCIAAVQVLVMATWFSASAVVPALRTEWALGTAGATWLTVSVQLGFVTGALTAAVLNLADRVPHTGSSPSARCSPRSRPRPSRSSPTASLWPSLCGS